MQDSMRPIDAPALHEIVYERLRGAIAAGQLPGRDDANGIGLQELARQLGVSTTPVREAVRRLEAEGLLELDRTAGVRVRRLSATELRELAEMRIRLESVCLARCIEIASPEEIDSIARLVDELDGISEPGEWRAANQRLHMAIYSAADYPRIVGTIRTLWVALEPYLQLYSRSPENRRAAQAEHHRLIESIRRGDNDVAVGILGAHIRRSQRALLQEPSLGR